MKFEEFKQMFISALETAANNAEEVLGKNIPRNHEIIMYGAGYSGDVVDIDEAAARLFIDENRFYRVIDIAVQQVSTKVSRVFVRVSGHKPVPLQETWNNPKGSGPFKQIIAQIKEVDV